jgi:acyl-CoA reductase-like NAD-dependent aldehyde dehydrogenase
MTASPTVLDEAKSTENGKTDARAILRRMQAAHRGKPAPSYDTRMDWLERLERTLLRRKDDIADAISKDFGNRSRHESLVAEVFVTQQAIKYARQHLRDWMEPEPREVGWSFLPAAAEVQYQPLGVVGIISPWNYPIQLALSPLVGALAAGNRAIIKPSEFVPRTSQLLDDMMRETFEQDVVAVVTGGPEVGEAFAKLPFDHLVFTGSTRIGKVVMRAAAENLVPVTLELGGKSPTIVGDDIPMEVAATRIMMGKCFNAGQTCIAPDYVFIPEGKEPAFVDACKAAVAKMYPTLANNPDFTAIVNERHHARLSGYVEDAKAKGARVVEINPAGESLDKEHKLAPTLVLDPSEDMLVMQDEIFGPVLPVKTYRALDEAIDYVNDHPRPLALYYFGHDRRAIDRVLEETISGGVSINETMLHCAQDDLPFGGVGPSGMGHYHAREGFEQFSKKKPIFRQARINATGLLRPPFGKAVNTFLKLVLGK